MGFIRACLPTLIFSAMVAVLVISPLIALWLLLVLLAILGLILAVLLDQTNRSDSFKD